MTYLVITDGDEEECMARGVSRELVSAQLGAESQYDVAGVEGQ